MQTTQIETMKAEVKQSLRNVLYKMEPQMFESLFDGAYQKAADELTANKRFICKASLEKSTFSFFEEMVGHDL